MSVPLRTCKVCGKVAYTEADLKGFATGRGRKKNHKICLSCVDKQIEAYLQKIEDKNDRRVTFRGKAFILDHVPRNTHCYLCGVTRTPLEPRFHLHHVAYDINDPGAYTLTLCESCHRKLHGLMQRGKKKPIPVSATV